jgi:hypothetical protein
MGLFGMLLFRVCSCVVFVCACVRAYNASVREESAQ